MLRTVNMLTTRIVNDMQLGGDYGTVLCAACANGKTEVVKALLGMGARLDSEGEREYWKGLPMLS
jgi:hypothetical protein